MSGDELVDHRVVRLARIARLALRLAVIRGEEARWDEIERNRKGQLRWLRADGTRP